MDVNRKLLGTLEDDFVKKWIWGRRWPPSALAERQLWALTIAGRAFNRFVKCFFGAKLRILAPKLRELTAFRVLVTTR